MKDERDEQYWEDAIGLLSGSLKTCQAQNRGDYTRAIIFAERKLRRLRNAAMAVVVCIVMALSGCAAVRGIGTDIQTGADAGAKGLQNYAESYNQQYSQPRIVN